MSRFIRLIELVSRISNSFKQLGAANTMIVFSYLAKRKKDAKIAINNYSFFFSPLEDKGALTHLYSENYMIIGCPSLIIDAGANIGVETLRFRYFHPNALILSIEPASRNIHYLRQSFGDDPKTIIIEAALSAHSGNVNLYRNNDNHESYTLNTPADNSSRDQYAIVKAMSINQILEQNNLLNHSIDILKVDIEGAEKSIFCEGDLSWLANVKVIVMEMPDSDMPESFQYIVNSLLIRKIRGSYFICGENIVFIKEQSGFHMSKVIGLAKH